MRISVSSETFEKLKQGEKVEEISFFPIDRNCDCDSIKKDWAAKFLKMTPEEMRNEKAKGIVECPRASMEGHKKYQIICANCRDILATVSLKDGDINTWCNLHYINEAKISTRIEIFHEKKKIKKELKLVPIKKKVEFGEWHGCMTPSISPVDGKLGFECACGNDTRDFRPKNNLTGLQLKSKLINNMKGRDFNKKDSKFILKEIN